MWIGAKSVRFTCGSAVKNRTCFLLRHGRIWARGYPYFGSHHISLRFTNRTIIQNTWFALQALFFLVKIIRSLEGANQWRDRGRKEGNKTPTHIPLNLSRVISEPPCQYNFSSVFSPVLVTNVEGVEIFVHEAWLGIKLVRDAWKIWAWYVISLICVKWNFCAKKNWRNLVNCAWHWSFLMFSFPSWPKFSI